MADTTANQQKANQQKWFTLTPEAAEQQLNVDPAKGLSAAEAKQRLLSNSSMWIRPRA
jgi:hypothetical protein